VLAQEWGRGSRLFMENKKFLKFRNKNWIKVDEKLDECR